MQIFPIINIQNRTQDPLSILGNIQKIMPREIDFKHFSKPMTSNILLEQSTALSKATIFSCLRQDLVRRLLHTRRETEWQSRLNLIEEYTQLLSNSGHKFSFSKSVILQAITKYETMVWRSELNKENKKYLPLYRERQFDHKNRIITKYINPSVWYSGEKVKDPYRNIWKGKIKRSFNRNLPKFSRALLRKKKKKKRRWKRKE